ncbi:MAG TPA: class II glutamine amidotransferase, partial [Dongiaceae bacterium]|nr:class II glutamine amidotransferase [Dongiaceae bacterium]
YERVRRRMEAMIDDRFYSHRVGTTDSELIFYLLFSEGLEEDPVGALTRTIGRIERLAREAAVNEPFKFTSVLSDGNFIYAVRHSTDDVPPTLFHCQRDDHFMVVSEPLDDEGNCEAWCEVPPGQMLVIQKNGRLQMTPFVPSI